MPWVRSFVSMEQLDNAAEMLPTKAYEALFFLGDGYSLEEVFREMGKSEDGEKVNTDDFETALENPDSKRHFFVVEDDLILQEMLKAPLDKWRVFLHPSQRNLVEREWNGPVRVLGGAGTGKTVVAMHRAKYLAEKIFTGEQDRILFTTFTRNLAADIQENLRKICPENIMRRIEVINLDRWVLSFLKKIDYNYGIDYGKQTKPLWEKALALVDGDLGLADTFFREEWKRVIQPNGITTFSEYAKISRIGRGVQLSRKKRKAIWPVFEEYRVLLNENHLREPDDAMRDARILMEKSDGDINGVCLVARTNNLLKQYEGALKARGKEICLIRRSEAEEHRKKGVRLATMHRVKGLEFDRVIIAGVNDGVVPLETGWNQSTDQVILKETETHERALLYVAATRAKKGVLVTSFGKTSRFLRDPDKSNEFHPR